MQFSIGHVIEKGLEQVILREETTGTEIAVLPGYGALLHGFRVRETGGGMAEVIDHYKDLAELELGLSKSFKSPKLSPFPCRLDAGKYQFEEKDHQLERLFSDGNAIHGLLYDKAFAVTEEKAEEGSATLSLLYRYKQEDAGYPFDYSCGVRYVLLPDNMLEVTTTVTNLDTVDLPIADGWHPYFQLGGRIDDWQLQFFASAIVEFNERLVPTGNLVQYAEFETARPIGDHFLDNCFVLKPGLVGPACEIYNPTRGLKVSFFPDEHYPYLQLYTPPGRESIAVENLSGAPDCFNNKMGLIVLAPGHSQNFLARYKVSVG